MGKYFNKLNINTNLVLNALGTEVIKITIGINEIDDKIAKKYPSIFEKIVEKKEPKQEKIIEKKEPEEIKLEPIQTEEPILEIEEVIYTEQEDIVKNIEQIKDKNEMYEYAKKYNIELRRNKSIINMKIDFVEKLNERNQKSTE